MPAQKRKLVDTITLKKAEKLYGDFAYFVLELARSWRSDDNRAGARLLYEWARMEMVNEEKFVRLYNALDYMDEMGDLPEGV